MKTIGMLHVLTDTVLQDRFTHVDLARLAIAGGADTIQYRQKTGTTREMIETAVAMQELCTGAAVTFIVNDRVDVAIAAEANGVHLGQEDFPVRKARELLGPEPIIGVTGKTIELSRRGIADGADYVSFGPIYATGSKPDARAPQGLGRLSEVVQALSMPVIAVGGIGVDTAEDVIRAGAHGIAVISAVCCQTDPAAATRVLMARILAGKV